jgi:hypothetical protein
MEWKWKNLSGASQRITEGFVGSKNGRKESESGAKKLTAQTKIQKQIFFLLNSNKIHTITEVTVLPHLIFEIEKQVLNSLLN